MLIPKIHEALGLLQNLTVLYVAICGHDTRNLMSIFNEIHTRQLLTVAKQAIGVEDI